MLNILEFLNNYLDVVFRLGLKDLDIFAKFNPGFCRNGIQLQNQFLSFISADLCIFKFTEKSHSKF